MSYSAPGLNSTDNGSGVYFSRTGAEGLDINAANATDSNTDASITSSTIQTALAEANVSLVASRDIEPGEEIRVSERTKCHERESNPILTHDHKMSIRTS